MALSTAPGHMKNLQGDEPVQGTGPECVEYILQGVLGTYIKLVLSCLVYPFYNSMLSPA